MIEAAWIAMAFVGGGFIVMVLNNLSWEWECVQRGFARYNPTTGVWEWIDDDIEKACRNERSNKY